LAARRDFGPALADLSKAIELSPNEPEFYYQRAETYSACGQRDRALKDYDRVLTLKQDFLPAYIPRALYARAVAESRKDERTDSASDVEAARQIAPDVAEIFARHGIVP
jgi:tetratricopeptide (TPR) repeat protein